MISILFLKASIRVRIRSRILFDGFSTSLRTWDYAAGDDGKIRLATWRAKVHGPHVTLLACVVPQPYAENVTLIEMPA